MKKPYKLDTNNHSVFKLWYHLIIVTKYRRKVITDAMEKELKSIFNRLSKTYNINLQVIGHEQDHVHILFTASPTTQLSKFINVFKSSSSRILKQNHPEIKKKLWKEYLWSKSYCLITTGGATIEVIEKYIESQGQEK